MRRNLRPEKPEGSATKLAAKGYYHYRGFTFFVTSVGKGHLSKAWVIDGGARVSAEMGGYFGSKRDAMLAIDEHEANKPGDGAGKVTSRTAQDRTKNGILARHPR